MENPLATPASEMAVATFKLSLSLHFSFFFVISFFTPLGSFELLDEPPPSFTDRKNSSVWPSEVG